MTPEQALETLRRYIIQAPTRWTPQTGDALATLEATLEEVERLREAADWCIKLAESNAEHHTGFVHIARRLSAALAERKSE